MSRHILIKELKRYGITDKRVISAITDVTREKFVPSGLKKRAYDNVALPIEKEQTISQPYVVALMTQSLLEHPNPQKILEIGTGSGYQTAILAKVFKHVWTIERIEALYLKAKKTLKSLEYDNVHCKLGDGTYGWIDDAPYDGIIVTAAAATIPTALLDQLNPAGGLMVIPIGRVHEVQQLTLLKRNGDIIEEKVIEQVSFVPLISDYH